MTTATTTTQESIALPSIQLLERSTPRTKPEFVSLEQLRSKVLDLNRVLQPQDREWRLADFHFSFEGRRALMTRIEDNGSRGVGYKLTRHALGGLSSAVLPARGMGFLSDLADLEPTPEELQLGHGDIPRRMAEGVMNRFLRAHGDAPQFIRTINLPNQGPTIRAILSQKFTAVDDHTILEQLLQHTQFRNLPVIQAHSTDQYTRIRLALAPVEDIRKPIPMVELWNSEVGCRRLIFNYGIFRLICTNGMHEFKPRFSYGWNHVGDASRIRRGLSDALVTIRREASGLLSQYNRALTIHISDVFSFVDGLGTQLPKEQALSEGQIKAVRAALLDPSTTQNGTVATVLDAVTLAAQKEELEGQHGMEETAAYILHRTLKQADRTGRDYITVQDTKDAESGKSSALIHW